MKQARRAFSLLELLVALSMGSLLLAFVTSSFMSASKVFRVSSGRDQCLRDLNRARQSLEFDLNQLSLSGYQIIKAPGSLGTGADGDAVDFVSAFNVTSGRQEILTDGSGQPYYYKNVIYYPTVPTNHDSLFGQSCSGGNDGGYDFNCPHKVLMRLEADENPAYDPTDPATRDKVIASLSPLLIRPTGFPKQLTQRVVCTGLLTMQVQMLPSQELVVNLQALSLQEAKRSMAVGATSARTSPQVVAQTFSVFPHNP